MCTENREVCSARVGIYKFWCMQLVKQIARDIKEIPKLKQIPVFLGSVMKFRYSKYKSSWKNKCEVLEKTFFFI